LHKTFSKNWFTNEGTAVEAHTDLHLQYAFLCVNINDVPYYKRCKCRLFGCW